MADGVRILYVDDETDLLEIAKIFLEKTTEFAIETKTSAQGALAALRDQHFDAIVSDYMMPGMDGIDFLKAVRERHGDIPFILFTGRGREEVVIQAINNGADSYLQKGGDPTAQFAELAHKVRQAVRRRKAEADGKATQEVFTRLFHANPSLEAVTDFATGRIIDVNEAWTKAIGYSRDEVIGRSTRKFDIFAGNEGLQEMAKILAETGKVHGLMTRLRTRSGETRFLDLTAQCIRVGNSTLLYTQAMDITDRVQAEEDLRRSEERYRSLFSNMLEGFARCRMLYDDDGRPADFVILESNAAFERITGRSGAAGRRFSEVFAGVLEASPELLVTCDRVVRTGTPGESDLAVPDIGRWLHISACSTGDGQFITSLTDITERKHADDSLRESAEKYRSLVENSPGIIWEMDLQGNLVYISPVVTGILGYLPEDLLGRPMIDFVPEHARPDILHELAQYLSSDEPLPPFEVPARHRDGHEMVLEIRPWKVTGPGGKIQRLRGVAIDVTGRRRTERELHESEELFRAVFNNANDVIQLVENVGGGPGRYLLVNDRMPQMLGYTREELMQMSPEDLVPPEIMDRVKAETMKKFAKDGSAIFESAYRRRDGSTVPIEVSIRPFRSRGKAVALSVIRDITERKKAEEALRRANRQLSLLSSITRHDILNKVTIILGFIRVIGKRFSDPALCDYLERIEAATNAIQQQIAFTRVYKDLGTQEPQWIPLGTVMPRSHVPATVALQADLQDVAVYADPMIGKVFFNLLDNAVRHGQRVTEIRVSCQRSGEDLVLAWEDNGVGIDTDRKEQIFERGFGENTGLGLFLAREILSLTGMTISENGRPGQGARFEIRVPKGTYRAAGKR